MANYTVATLTQWSRKSQRRLDAIVAQSTNDTIVRATRIVPGKSRGGELQRGFVPRDTGVLAASLVSTLYGGTAITQPGGAFNLVVGAMKAGDVATFTWTASYARPVHYGTRGNAGWHWVTEAVVQWRPTVAAVTARAKAMYP